MNERFPRERFQVRPGSDGYSVLDLWTGEAAVIAMTPQRGLSEPDARHTAGLLNRSSQAEAKAGGDSRPRPNAH